MGQDGVKDTLNTWATAMLGRAGYSPQRSRDAKREAWWWLKARAAARPGRGLYGGQAVVWTHPGRCELLRVDEPGPSADQVTVAVAHTIVSAGTERAALSGRTIPPTRYPERPGYAAAGVVLAAGSAAGLAPGVRVAAPIAHASVGTVDAASVYPVPDGVPLEDAAFTQLGIIARRGTALGRLQAGEQVCVLGGGLVGSLALRLAVAAGAGSVTAVARSRRSEARARAGGADRFLATGDGDDVRGVAAPLVIDASGDPDALHDAVAAAADGGRVVVLGSPRGVTRDVPVDELRHRGITIVGAHVSTLSREGGERPFRREALLFLDQLARRELRVDDLVEAVLDPREAPAFYRSLGARTTPGAARFDWTRLPMEERGARRSRLAPPRLAARGVDFGRAPVSVPEAVSRSFAPDPLAGARGSLGIAAVGCGDIGIQNAEAIAAAPNARLVACFDTVTSLAEEIALAHGADVARSYDELLQRPDVEAVFLSVPHDLHAPLAIRAAEAGRHVIVEKPPAATLDAALEMAEAARRTGVSITVCFPQRYHGAIAAARTLVEQGALGELRGTYVSFLTDKPPAYWHGGFSGRAASDWRLSSARAGGGVLIMNLSHYVDLMLLLAGQPVEQVAALVSSVDPASEVEDFVSASVRYANRAVGTVFGGAAVPGTWEGGTSTELRIWGDLGHISLGRGLEVYSLRPVAGLQAGRWHRFEGVPSHRLRAAFVSRFATALHDGRAPDVPLDQALAVQGFIEATYRSAAEGRPVTPEDLYAAVSTA